LANFRTRIKRIVKGIVAINEADGNLSLKFKKLQTMPGVAINEAIGRGFSEPARGVS
jgi:hypothetical protein